MTVTETREFDVNAAYEGMTIRHIPSQKVYTVTRVNPVKGQHDAYVNIKDAYGRGAFVGTEFFDPSEFVSLHTR